MAIKWPALIILRLLLCSYTLPVVNAFNSIWFQMQAKKMWDAARSFAHIDSKPDEKPTMESNQTVNADSARGDTSDQLAQSSRQGKIETIMLDSMPKSRAQQVQMSLSAEGLPIPLGRDDWKQQTDPWNGGPWHSGSSQGTWLVGPSGEPRQAQSMKFAAMPSSFEPYSAEQVQLHMELDNHVAKKQQPEAVLEYQQRNPALLAPFEGRTLFNPQFTTMSAIGEHKGAIPKVNLLQTVERLKVDMNTLQAELDKSRKHEGMLDIILEQDKKKAQAEVEQMSNTEVELAQSRVSAAVLQNKWRQARTELEQLQFKRTQAQADTRAALEWAKTEQRLAESWQQQAVIAKEELSLQRDANLKALQAAEARASAMSRAATAAREAAKLQSQSAAVRTASLMQRDAAALAMANRQRELAERATSDARREAATLAAARAQSEAVVRRTLQLLRNMTSHATQHRVAPEHNDLSQPLRAAQLHRRQPLIQMLPLEG